MCEICRRSPCDARCPNAPEPRAIYKCAYCGEGITNGEKYLEYNGKYYHLDCIEEMSSDEIAKMFGCSVETADEDDLDYPWEED